MPNSPGWSRPRDDPRPYTTKPVPAEVRVVLAQRLFVEKARLPSALLNQVKRLAAFQNPEFYRRQKARLSTALTPRVIACAGLCRSRAAAWPRRRTWPSSSGAMVRRFAWTTGGWRVEPSKPAFTVKLTPVQQDAVKQLLTHDTGGAVAPPGTGKTVGVPTSPRLAGTTRWCWSTASHYSISGGRSSRAAKAIGQIGGGRPQRAGSTWP